MFDWSPECAKAFEDLKGYLTSPLILSKLVDKEELYIYLVVFTYTINSVLVRIAEGTKKLVYYISKALEDVDTKYFDIKKLALCHGLNFLNLVHAALSPLLAK